MACDCCPGATDLILTNDMGTGARRIMWLCSRCSRLHIRTVKWMPPDEAKAKLERLQRERWEENE